MIHKPVQIVLSSFYNKFICLTIESANYGTKDDYIISSDESDIEDNDETYSETDKDEQNFGNERDCDTIFRLNKSDDDHVGNTQKHSKPDARNNVWSDFEFEEKMYRVIPLKLDEKIFESKRSALTDKNQLERKNK
ncbi:hypothetical protein K0M31_017210 [Melipona bicolor]|uniref:Uncharacterized protein n=1 Tax=Melipona bicolor TaxID=60889 RepID=A0AA40G4G3_9HYME|nr:hypothetical protein K0M31_017210 [Melipona bicolor]